MARNKRPMLKWIIILAAVAMVIWGGALAFRHFVTDRIMDGATWKTRTMCSSLTA